MPPSSLAPSSPRPLSSSASLPSSASLLESASPMLDEPSSSSKHRDLDSWAQYVEQCRTGRAGGWISPPKPEVLQAIAFRDPSTTSEDSVEDRGVEGHGRGTSRRADPSLRFGTAEYARKVYEETGVMPGILGEHEDERLKVLQKFKLSGLRRTETIDRIVDLVKEFFKCPVVVVSLVFENREVLVSTSGWDPHEREPDFAFIDIPINNAFCPHAMSRPEEEKCFLLENTAADWRFENNPYVKNGGPIAFFASSNLNLPAVSKNVSIFTGNQSPRRLPVGSLCIVDHVPRTDGEFSDKDATMLRGFADLITTELQSSSERTKLESTEKQNAFLGSFLRSTLVQSPSTDLTNPNGPDGAHTRHLGMFHDAARSVLELSGSDSVAILDLRAFQTPLAPLPSHLRRRASKATSDSTAPSQLSVSSALHSGSAARSGSEVSGEEQRPRLARNHSGESVSSMDWHGSKWRVGKAGKAGKGLGSISVLGSAGNYNWEGEVGTVAAMSAVTNAITDFYANGTTEFDGVEVPSPLHSILPPGTHTYLAIPIFDHEGHPALYMIACSFQKYFEYEETARLFVENVGAVAISCLLRQRILDADRAKLAFVSQISHELRTPLFAIDSQIELIRLVASPQTLASIKPLLDTAEVSCASLREILEDTLEFAKLSNKSQSDHARQAILTDVDLEELIEQVLRTCWTRSRHRGAVITGKPVADRELDMILDYHLKFTRVLCDVGGLKRVLFNLIGNSLKFTESGSITITVKQLPVPPPEAVSGVRLIRIDITDTGIGMSKEFMAEQLYIPFRQQDSFSQGTGLGVSIVSSIVARMKAKLSYDSVLGKGTTASIHIPLQVVRDAEGKISRRPPGVRRMRIISDELSRLLDPANLGDPLAAVVPQPVPEVNATDTTVESLVEMTLDDKPRILVVDDNHITRRVLMAYLKTKKVNLVDASNGLEAVQRFKEFCPHMVWMDIQMPIMDGIEASARMREHECDSGQPRAQIIAISGLSDDLGANTRYLQNGQLDDWIVKGGASLKKLGASLEKLRAQLTLDQPPPPSADPNLNSDPDPIQHLEPPDAQHPDPTRLNGSDSIHL